MIAACCLLLVQAGAGAGSGWTAAPARPTVGDTIRLERTIAAPGGGWRVRAGKLEPGSGAVAEPLGDPVVFATSGGGGWTVRYFVVAWAPGTVTVPMPPIWRLGPDGSADSVPGGTAAITVASVIPDSVEQPHPQPALTPFRLQRRGLWPPVVAVGLAVGSLAGLLAWRRRPPRRLDAPPPVVPDAEVPDSRWLAAGEPKAVAARAAHRLRAAIAAGIPAAHDALSTAEVLVIVERERPGAPLRELRDVLAALDQVAFATAHGDDVAALAARARRLAEELAP
jgi:hypothetical protein